MHIVIDIPDYMYEVIKRDGSGAPKAIDDAIANGTPLPKGHGKIIDIKDLLDRVELEDNDSNREYNVGSIITLEDVDFIPTIVPADEEGN